MAEGLEIERLRPLFDVVPPEFVAARNALVKELKAAKEREAAAVVATVRRPSWVDWALNQVAVVEPAAVADFVAAADELRDAQAATVEGRDGPNLRVSMTALRSATATVARAAAARLTSAGRPPVVAEIGARLGAVAAQAAAVGQFRTGVLGSTDLGDDDPFADLTPATTSRRTTSPTGKRAGARSAPAASPPRDRTSERKEEDDRKDEDDGDGPAQGDAGDRPPLRVVEGGRAPASGADVRAAEKAAARQRARSRAPLSKAVDAAQRRRSVAVDKVAAARRGLDEAETVLAEIDGEVAIATARLAGFDAGALTP